MMQNVNRGFIAEKTIIESTVKGSLQLKGLPHLGQPFIC